MFGLTYSDIVQNVCLVVLFMCCAGCVMALQFRYQKSKLYRQVAMGQSHQMTVSQGNIISVYIRLANSMNYFL